MTLRAIIGTLGAIIGTLGAIIGTLRAIIGTLGAIIGTLRAIIGTLRAIIVTAVGSAQGVVCSCRSLADCGLERGRAGNDVPTAVVVVGVVSVAASVCARQVGFVVPVWRLGPQLCPR